MNGIELPNGNILHLVPKTTNYADLLNVSGDSMIKALANKQIANYIKDLKNEDGLPLVLPSHEAPPSWVTIDKPAIQKTIIVGNDVTMGNKINPDLQKVLYDMGIAIS